MGIRRREESNGNVSPAQIAVCQLTINSGSTTDENLSEDIDQLFELTKIMVLVLSGLVPGLENSNTKGTF